MIAVAPSLNCVVVLLLTAKPDVSLALQEGPASNSLL
jgi:hypothetical protein